MGQAHSPDLPYCYLSIRNFDVFVVLTKCKIGQLGEKNENVYSLLKHVLDIIQYFAINIHEHTLGTFFDFYISVRHNILSSIALSGTFHGTVEVSTQNQFHNHCFRYTLC
jgi:hypothetical protein